MMYEHDRGNESKMHEIGIKKGKDFLGLVGLGSSFLGKKHEFGMNFVKRIQFY